MATGGERALALLRDEAKRTGSDVQALAVSYAIERFTERLMRLDEQGTVAIKGGQSLGIVFGNPMRPTKDLDLNFARSDHDGEPEPPETLRDRAIDLVRAACADPAEDGVAYDLEGVRVEFRRQQAEGGVRISIPASIHTCLASFVIDLGLDNEMSFAPSVVRVEGILSKRKAPPAAVGVRIYPVENTIAEKIASKIEDGSASIRHKDFYDLWLLMETALRVGDLSLLDRGDESEGADPFDRIDPKDLSRLAAVRAGLVDGSMLEIEEIGIAEDCLDRLGYALARTFGHRGTEMPDNLADRLTEDFGRNALQSTQWAAWCRNNVKRLRFIPPLLNGPDAKSTALMALVDRMRPFLEDIRAHVPGVSVVSSYR